MNLEDREPVSETKVPSAEEMPSFEASLNELQELVHVLEEGALGLEESIVRFERGILLLRRCYQALERAEQKIELLMGFDSEGNPLTSPFNSEATIESSVSMVTKRSKRSIRKQAEPLNPAEDSNSEGGDESVRLF